MNFLIYSFTGLGNSILFNPCINYLKSKYPECKITIASYDVDGDLSFQKLNKLVDNTLNFRQLNIFNKLKFVNDLFFKKYDYVIYFSLSYPGRLLSFFTYSFARCPILRSKNQVDNILNRSSIFEGIIGRIYYNLSMSIRYITNQKKNIFYAGNLNINSHEIDHNLDIIRCLMSNPQLEKNNYAKNKLKIDFDKSILKKYNLTEKKYLCLQVAGGHGQLTPKIPTTSKIKLIISKLLSLDYKIILLGTNNEKNILEELQSNKNILSLIGETSPLECASLLKYAFFTICNDSGLLHLADALRVNVIALFGPTNINKNRPLNDTSFIIKNTPSCGGCIKGWNIKGHKYVDEQTANDCQYCLASMNQINENKIIEIIKNFVVKKENIN